MTMPSFPLLGFLGAVYLDSLSAVQIRWNSSEYCMFAMCAKGIIAVLMGLFTIGAKCPSVQPVSHFAAQCIVTITVCVAL